MNACQRVAVKPASGVARDIDIAAGVGRRGSAYSNSSYHAHLLDAEWNGGYRYGTAAPAPPAAGREQRHKTQYNNLLQGYKFHGSLSCREFVIQQKHWPPGTQRSHQ